MTHIEAFATFVESSGRASLPEEVSEEAKRIILDSIGCALAATETPAARAGIEYGRVLGGDRDEATIVGQPEPSSVHGATFANAEMMNALDFDAVAAPGHVAPYGVPVALALGEALRTPGRLVVAAVAVCHEMSYRFAKAMDRNRDVKEGRAHTAPVLGYASTVFGIAGAAALMKSMDADAVADALGIAGATSPVNAHRAWLAHAPAATIKNHLMPGGVAMTGLTAAYMAELGHRGDRQILDDAQFGYPQFIGSRRWEPSDLTSGLLKEWRFPSESYLKPWPHCRVPHALFDALADLVRENGLHPSEIESITAWGEEWASQFPTFMTREIHRPFDAQFSFAHGLAMVAHQVPPGRAWQDPAVVYDESVLGLMSRVVWKPHPDWAAAVARNPAARPSRVEVDARGTTFVGERDFPRGSRSPDPSTHMSTAEVVDKFLHNAEGVIDADAAARIADHVMDLEQVENVAEVLRLLRPVPQTAVTNRRTTALR